MFTDADYGSIDFNAIDTYLLETFPFVAGDIGGLPSFGKSYLIGQNLQDHVKLDVYYSQEKFIRSLNDTEFVKLASIDDLVSMKTDIISRGGRKKDFWDLHELIHKYDLAKMLALHEERHPYTHNKGQLITNFTDFTKADEDFDPICLRGKYWEFIKDDFKDFVENKNL